jgi:formylglycine-generating enzyme required for sulfatase activity
MSGNVFEWTFDWGNGEEGSRRELRGGSWLFNDSGLQTGFLGDELPHFEYESFGLRPARSAE